MKFFLLDEGVRTQDSIPNVLVTFPDGYTDRLILSKHYFNEEDRVLDDDDCTYIGHLLKEKDACDLERLSRLFLDHVMETKFKLAQEDPKLVEMYKQPTTDLLNTNNGADQDGSVES